LNAIVDIIQVVEGPVPTLAFGVAPWPTIASSIYSSMSDDGKILARLEKPVPAVSVC
jgi:hypothetical protein